VSVATRTVTTVVDRKTDGTVNQPDLLSYSVSHFRLALVREGDAGTLEDPVQREPLAHPGDVARFLARLLAEEPGEVMGALYLDTRNRLLGVTLPYRGTLDRVAVEPRALLTAGLLMNAASMIAFHNHPSGDPEPSAEDLSFTRRLCEAGEVVGLRLVDHMVIGDGGRWTSLKARGGW